MRTFTLSTWLCAALVAPAFAATHKVPTDEPIATFSVPDKWQTKERVDNIEATSPDGTMHFLILQPEGRKIAEGMGEIMRYIRNSGNVVVQADSMKNEPGKLNGADVRNVSWQGKNKDGDVTIKYIIMTMPENRSLIVATWGSPAAEKKYQADLKKMLQSIKKAQVPETHQG
jgi:hypothetical protein